jgi:hypothetical protein
MSFQPIAPLGGLAGWRFVERTEATQRAAYAADPVLSREIEHFKTHIGEAATAEDLVADRRLLRVALGAFGLEDDIDKRAFIRRVLEEGVGDESSFANRLVDKRYRKLAEAFGYGDAGAKVDQTGFAEEIAARYELRRFEVAMGESDEDMRLALNFRREIASLAASGSGDTVAWLTVLGDQPLRTVFESAFALPSGFGKLDLDRQIEELRGRVGRLTGDETVAGFTSPDAVDQVLRNFFARRAAEAGPSAATPGVAALSLLQSGGLGASAMMNLLASKRS